MIEFITSLLDAQIDYIGLLTAVFVYIAAMWVAFTIWVFIDARKKFKSIWKALLLTLFVFPLNIPGFILYLIFRPEHDDLADISVVDAAGHQHHYGGVQVPLVHFTGQQGEVQMTFGLTINPKAITNHSPDMNIDISWDSKDENLTLKTDQPLRPSVVTMPARNVEVQPATGGSQLDAKITSSVMGIKDRLQSSFSAVAATVGGSLSKSTKDLEDNQEEDDSNDELITAEQTDTNQSNQSNQSKKKKKHRR
jgi:hypothetical protein